MMKWETCDQNNKIKNTELKQDKFRNMKLKQNEMKNIRFKHDKTRNMKLNKMIWETCA